MSADNLSIAVKAAREAGAILREALSQGASVIKADGKDIKHEADLKAEAAVLEILKSESGIPVLSEEAGASEGFSDKEFWVVDPLDGTFNYTRGFPIHCVAIALCCSGDPVLGVIYDFQNDLLYEGSGDRPAHCNGELMSVSPVTEQGQAALATGFPVGRSYEGDSLLRFVEQVKAFKKIRMIGSAASSLALVARGVFDAYFEEDINLWDVAAGMALVKAAGGTVEVMEQDANHRVTVFAHNGNMTLNKV